MSSLTQDLFTCDSLLNSISLGVSAKCIFTYGDYNPIQHAYIDTEFK